MPHYAGRNPYRLLDAWRGVAALWVVLLHTRLPGIPAPLYAWSAGGHLGVPMFFVISGPATPFPAAAPRQSP